jgi:hypothetical protein
MDDFPEENGQRHEKRDMPQVNRIRVSPNIAQEVPTICANTAAFPESTSQTSRDRIKSAPNLRYKNVNPKVNRK